MKRFLVLGGMLLLVLTFSLWTGCSDDDDGGTTPTLAQGDTLDPGFIAFRDGSDATNEVTDMMLEMVFNIADSVLHDAGNPNAKVLGIPTASSVEADSVLLTYHAASQYWYVYAYHDSETDTSRVIDSLQFLHASGPVQWPDSASLTGMKSGMSFYWSVGDGVVDATQSLTMTGDFANMGVITISGAQNASITYSDSRVEFPSDSMGCDFAFVFSSTYTNITMNLQNFGDGCPSAGSLVHTVTTDIECSNETDTLTVGGGWKISETFTGTVANWVIENSTTRWTGVDSCGSSMERTQELPPVFYQNR